MLEARQLEATRDDRVLFTKVDFRLDSGGILQIAGPNGAGKTTLLNVVAGLVSPSDGTVSWAGQPVDEDPSAFRRSVSYLGHLGGLKLGLSPVENLRFLCSLRGLEVTADTLWQALKQVGLYGYEEVPLARLSAGQKRRASLARLFVEGAPLWILDEPFTAIDRVGVAELERWLGEHIAKGGMVLLTTHHEFAPDFLVQRLDVASYRPRRSA